MYRECRVGTKLLIQNYIDEIVHHFHYICETHFDEFEKKKKYQFMLNTQRAYGRTALLLSGIIRLVNHINMMNIIIKMILIIHYLIHYVN